MAARHTPRTAVLIVTPSDFSVAIPAPASTPLDWVGSANRQQISGTGQCVAALLPHDDDLVLVLPPRAVSWHRVALPRMATNRLRSALEGLLEDRLLADVTELHFALEPGGRPGRTVWVAACDKAWLRSWLQILEGVGRPVRRIVPALWPLARPETAPTPPDASPGTVTEPSASVHWAHHEGGQVWLGSAGVLGVGGMPWSGPRVGGARAGSLKALMPADAGDHDSWLAEPAVAAAAEQAWGRRVELVARPEWLLRCARSDWNLAQFDLSLSAGARRGQRWQRSLQRWLGAPEWRPARRAVLALAGVQLVGLNTAAWHEQEQLAARQHAVRQTLQQSFPQVTLVVDAPLQMQRELARLQQASGALSPGDLETQLAAIDLAAAGRHPTPATITYAPGDSRFSGWSATDGQLHELQQALQRAGWRARLQGGELALSPSLPETP